MVELYKVLGTVLKDLAQSRVISDTFSRDISIEYEEDPILRLFPVPRIDIKEVTVSLPFTIKSVKPAAANKEGAVRPLLRAESIKLTDHVLDRILLGHRNREGVLSVLEKTQFKKRLQKILEEKLSSNLHNIVKALDGDTTDLSAVLAETVLTMHSPPLGGMADKPPNYYYLSYQ